MAGSGDTGTAVPGSWLHDESRLLLACRACNLCFKLRRSAKNVKGMTENEFGA